MASVSSDQSPKKKQKPVDRVRVIRNYILDKYEAKLIADAENRWIYLRGGPLNGAMCDYRKADFAYVVDTACQELRIAYSASLLASVVGPLNGMAHTQVDPVYGNIRYGLFDGGVCVNCGNEKVLTVLRDGRASWDTLMTSPVMFNPDALKTKAPYQVEFDRLAAADMKPLLSEMFGYIREEFHPFLFGWMAASIIAPKVKMPIVAILGNAGSGKSTIAEIMQEIVDPLQAGICRLPEDQRELMTMLSSGSLCILDDLRRISADVGTILKVATTSKTVRMRRMYCSTNMEALVPGAIILTSTSMPNCADDLLSRIVPVYTGTKKGANTMLLKKATEEYAPSIRGILLRIAASTDLRILCNKEAHPQIDPFRNHPAIRRFPEFFLLVCMFAQMGGYSQQEVMDALDTIVGRSIECAEETGLLVNRVRDVLAAIPEEQQVWDTTAQELWDMLVKDIPADVLAADKSIPVNAIYTGRKLRRMAGTLEKLGWQMTTERTPTSRVMRFTRIDFD